MSVTAIPKLPNKPTKPYIRPAKKEAKVKANLTDHVWTLPELLSTIN